jgi:hypothetical protein
MQSVLTISRLFPFQFEPKNLWVGFTEIALLVKSSAQPTHMGGSHQLRWVLLMWVGCTLVVHNLLCNKHFSSENLETEKWNPTSHHMCERRVLVEWFSDIKIFEHQNTLLYKSCPYINAFWTTLCFSFFFFFFIYIYIYNIIVIIFYDSYTILIILFF